MIKHLTGTVFETMDQSIVVSTQGVGYEVFVPSHKLLTYSVGTPTSLWIHHALREQSSDLYGFDNKKELDFFELLLTVSGVGPKSALSIMDKSSIEVIYSGISKQDPNHLVKVAGLGKKMAEKLILSLKDKISIHSPDTESISGQHKIDAIDALISLGFSEKQARDSIQSMDESLSTGEMIKKALQEIK